MTRQLTDEELSWWHGQLAALTTRRTHRRKRAGPKFKTHCKRGHEIIRRIDGSGYCKLCKAEASERFNQRRLQ